MAWKPRLLRKLRRYLFLPKPLPYGDPAALALEVARRNAPADRAYQRLRAMEAEALAALEAGQPRAAAAGFRRQEALARRMVADLLPHDSLEPARAAELAVQALGRAGEPFGDGDEAARRGLGPSRAELLARWLCDDADDHARAGRLLVARVLAEAAIALFTPWQESQQSAMNGLRQRLVRILEQLGDLAEVERQLRLVLAAVERRGDPLRSAHRDALAFHCKTQGRWEEALALYSQSLAESLADAALADAETKADDLQTATVERMRVAEALHHLGREAEAFAELDQAEAEIVAQEGPESGAVATAQRLRAKLLRRDGREDEARALEGRAEVIMAEWERREREAPPDEVAAEDLGEDGGVGG